MFLLIYLKFNFLFLIVIYATTMIINPVINCCQNNKTPNRIRLLNRTPKNITQIKVPSNSPSPPERLISSKRIPTVTLNSKPTTALGLSELNLTATIIVANATHMPENI